MKSNKVVPLEAPEVIHLDDLCNECGMFTTDTELNNGYGCLSDKNTEHPGCCFSFTCPIACEIDAEDEEWDEGYSESKWMKQWAEFNEEGKEV